jgi:hypothetical protein
MKKGQTMDRKEVEEACATVLTPLVFQTLRGARISLPSIIKTAALHCFTYPDGDPKGTRTVGETMKYIDACKFLRTVMICIDEGGHIE